MAARGAHNPEVAGSNPAPAFLRCPSRKVPYLKAQHARAAASRFRRRFGNVGMHAYRCPHCDFWHIGHRAGTKRSAA